MALGSVMVRFSNYSYEPSLGTRPGSGRALVTDAPVGEIVSDKLQEMIQDAAIVQEKMSLSNDTPQAKVHLDSLHHLPLETRLYPDPTTVVARSGPLKAIEKQNLGTFWQTVRDKESDLDVQVGGLNDVISPGFGGAAARYSSWLRP